MNLSYKCSAVYEIRTYGATGGTEIIINLSIDIISCLPYSHNDNLLIVITINVFSSYYCESKTKRKRTFRSFAYLAERYCRTCALSSPLRRLTSVFGMGTGVPAAPFPPDPPRVIPQSRTHYSLSSLLWPGPRPISAGPLSMSPCLHSRSINLVVFEGP